MSESGYVYVAEQKDSPGYCKVGKTRNPDSREKNLSGSAMAQIDIVECVQVDDMDAVEKAFHAILPRKNRQGEWFNIETERVLPMLQCLKSKQQLEAPTQPSRPQKHSRSQAGSALPGKTPQAEFRQLIVDVLKGLGGRGHAKDVIAGVGERVDLRAGDLETYDSGQVVWENSVYWARQKLKEEGILKSNSKRGVWELAGRKGPRRKASGQKKHNRNQLRSALPGKTRQAEFRRPIVDVLKGLGGRGHAKDVIAGVGERVDLRAGDLETYDSGQVVWENSVYWARQKLKEEGILKPNSKRGVWELA